MSEEYWSAVREVRLRLADMLDTLSPSEWDTASLCEGWRVRDVAGHLALVPTITAWQMVAAAPWAHFNPNRINTRLAVRAGSVATSEIVKKLRDHAADRTKPKPWTPATRSSTRSCTARTSRSRWAAPSMSPSTPAGKHSTGSGPWAGPSTPRSASQGGR